MTDGLCQRAQLDRKLPAGRHHAPGGGSSIDGPNRCQRGAVWNRPSGLCYVARVWHPKMRMMLPMMDVLRKFGRLSWRDRLLLVEATFWLAIATFTVAVLPLRAFGGLAAVPDPQREKPQQTGAQIGREVCWAIVACARRLPWRTGCLQRGIAAQIMLKRRGIPSVLHFDEAPRDGHALAAHIWTRDLNLHLINDEIDPHFAPLAPFPSPDLPDSKAGVFRQVAQFREDRGPQA
jgi:hypothetical protein